MSKATGWKRMLPNVYARYRADLGHPSKCMGTRLVDGVVVECGRPIEVGDWYYRTGGAGKGHGHLLCSECAMDLEFPQNEGHT